MVLYGRGLKYLYIIERNKFSSKGHSSFRGLNIPLYLLTRMKDKVINQIKLVDRVTGETMVMIRFRARQSSTDSAISLLVSGGFGVWVVGLVVGVM